jgi:type IV pilus assembly protein PilB
MLAREVITTEQLEKARNIQTQTLERLEDILIRMGFLSERDVLDVWADFLGAHIVDLTNIKVDAKILSLIPEYQAKQYKAIPLKKTGTKLSVVMADPFDILALDMIAFLTQCKLEVSLAPKAQIDLAIKQLYSWEGFSVAGEENLLGGGAGDEGIEIARKTSEEGPVVQFLNAIFKQAILKRSSDIHIEPREDILLVRFRVDGTLHDAMTGPKSLLAPLISRVKILAHLDISEKRLPQDGRLKVKMDTREVDFRVSTVPSLLGEKAVLRLLSRESAFELNTIGFHPEDLDRLKASLDEPYGMILVTGPTGAGKTTTLFGMLKYFNSSEINIFTIENPIEYRIDGITQVQINDKVGLSFAAGLRASLRQDPDIILVGEVRDLETAEIAFRAALTGHKVLSTLHTNNAPATINRLINMGVPPYLVSAAVQAVVAQKLLHRICPACQQEYRPTQKTISRMKLPPAKVAAAKFLRGTGCKECNQTGVYGRIGVYETMVINNAIKECVLEGATESVLKRIARLNGMKTMRELAVDLAFAGKTTLEEVLYITPTDEDTAQYSFASAMNAPRPAATAGTFTADPGTIHPGGSPPTHGVDMNDPVLKSVLRNIEEDFLFFTDEELGSRFQLLPGQIRECVEFLGLHRTREGFQQKYGRFPEEMSEDEVVELIQTAQERGGHLPDFLFSQETSARQFARIMTGMALRTLADKKVEPQKIPQEFSDVFCREYGLDLPLHWAGNSRFRLIETVRPGVYKPWEFGETAAWLEAGPLSDKAREALEWLMTARIGCSRDELPGRISAEVLKECGLEELLKKFDRSVFALTQSAFPGVFQPWQFVDEEAVIWFREDRLETAKAAVRWLIERKLQIPVEEIPQKLGVRDFHQHGLSKLLDLFDQNLFLVVDNAFNGRFKPWEYAEQETLWQDAGSLDMAREATLWLISDRLQWNPESAASQLTRRHFINYGLGFMLGTLFNHSPFLAIENVFPDLKSNELFQKAAFLFSQELRDITSKWNSMAEKIAINAFGKARFKVVLPNLKIAPIVPENERIYFSAANRIEYVPQIIVPKISAYDDFNDTANWVPYCDRLSYWILADDRGPGYAGPSHPKVKLVFADSHISSLRTKGQLDIVDKILSMKGTFERLLDRKAPLLAE